jgi:hypothetical protein
MKTVLYLIQNKEVAKELLRRGVLPTSLFNKLEIYLYYRDLKELGFRNRESVKKTAIYFRISSRLVYKIVSFMNAE